MIKITKNIDEIFAKKNKKHIKQYGLKTNLHYTRDFTSKRVKEKRGSFPRLGNTILKKRRSGGEPLARMRPI